MLSWIRRWKERRAQKRAQGDLEKMWEEYCEAGIQFAGATNLLPSMGQCENFDELLDNYAYLEQCWMDQGYRTVPFPEFQKCEFADRRPEMPERRPPDEPEYRYSEACRAIFQMKLPHEVDASMVVRVMARIKELYPERAPA